MTDERVDRRTSRARLILAAAAIVLLSLNLRIPTVALGPLLPTLQADTGHGETFLSLLTAIPLVITLAAAPIAPRLATRLGRDRIIGWALVAVIAGTFLRSVPGNAALLSGTALLGVAIAFGTVLAPAAIASAHPRHRAMLTGAYTMALSLGPALALGLTVPMMRGTGLGWRETLVLWSGCTVIALVLWVAHARADGRDRPAAPAIARRGVVADPRVWQLAGYLGITSLTFYTLATWLPTTLVQIGLDSGAAGGYTSLINIVAIPLALLAPLVRRAGYGRVLAPAAPLLAVVGVVLLMTAGSGGVLAVSVLLGASQGLCLGVAYGQIVDYATSPEHAASVAALTSAVGIALAAVGPLAYGFGLESTGSYTASLVGLGIVVLAQTLLGLRTGRAADRQHRRV